jgi:hypothetical protein
MVSVDTRFSWYYTFNMKKFILSIKDSFSLHKTGSPLSTCAQYRIPERSTLEYCDPRQVMRKWALTTRVRNLKTIIGTQGSTFILVLGWNHKSFGSWHTGCQWCPVSQLPISIGIWWVALAYILCVRNSHWNTGSQLCIRGLAHRMLGMQEWSHYTYQYSRVPLRIPNWNPVHSTFIQTENRFYEAKMKN